MNDIKQIEIALEQLSMGILELVEVDLGSLPDAIGELSNRVELGAQMLGEGDTTRACNLLANRPAGANPPK